ncbi:MAG: hypothetical protein KAW12_11185 [Candidatus Aminicenantes bacterium]|nr:hypothetical protein [Candidatus Aminicenantes bacterium]
MRKSAVVLFVFMIFMNINLSPEKIAVFPNIYQPSMMNISGDEIYILDGFSVKIYSMKDYRFLREFGKKGEGPGELLTTSDTGLTMIVIENNILLNSVYKIVIYNRIGKILKEKKFRDYLVEAVPINGNYVLTFYKWIDEAAHAITKLSDKNFKEINELYKTKLPQNHKIKKISIPPLCTYVRTTKDRIFLFDQQKDAIKIFNGKGNPKTDITFKYDKIMTTQIFKDKIMNYLLSTPALKRLPENIRKRYLERVYTPNILPVFKNSWIINNQIYIHTYREKQNKGEFLILDFSGKVEKVLYLPGSAKLNIRINPASIFTFHKGKYYYLLENLDQEEWELHVIQLD